MAIEQNTTTLFIPGLRPIYDRLSIYTGVLLRIVTGAVMIPHGYQHYFGRQTLPEWFSGVEPSAAPEFGAGLEPFTEFLASQGYEPAYMWALLITFVQFFGGILLVFGLFTRLAAAAIAIFLFVAIFQVVGQSSGSWEMPLLWCTASLIFVVCGGGRFSVDYMIGKEL